jgi:hypothetical protein
VNLDIIKVAPNDKGIHSLQIREGEKMIGYALYLAEECACCHEKNLVVVGLCGPDDPNIYQSTVRTLLYYLRTMALEESRIFLAHLLDDQAFAQAWFRKHGYKALRVYRSPADGRTRIVFGMREER